MVSFFSAAGRTRFLQFAHPGLLCAFDFDGTLAPIVTQPERARIPTSVISRLNELAHYTPVAIITGRTVADVSSRLGFEPTYVVGNHGIEGLPGWEKSATKYAALCSAWADTLIACLQQAVSPDAGIWIEHKQYSLSVHYRMARDRAAAEKMLIELFAVAVPSAKVTAGKCVFNLLPDGAADKGVALEKLISVSGSSGAIFVGDDVTDEAVFRLRRPDLLSIRVEHDPHSAAEFFVSHRVSVLQILDDLVLRFRQNAVSVN